MCENVLRKYPNLYYFANYHNPIYPSCSNPSPNSEDYLVIQQGLKYWTPIFDKYKFIASFEHHNHYRKMTKKIKNDTINQEGTRYLGDGCLGVSNYMC
jgi:hypothetical protein